MPADEKKEGSSSTDNNKIDSLTEDDLDNRMQQSFISEDRTMSDHCSLGNMKHSYRSISEPNMNIRCFQYGMEPPNSADSHRSPDRTVKISSEYDVTNVKPSNCETDDIEYVTTVDQKSIDELPELAQDESATVPDDFVVVQLKIGPLTTVNQNKSSNVVHSNYLGNNSNEKNHRRNLSLPNNVGYDSNVREHGNHVVNIRLIPGGVYDSSNENQERRDIVLVLSNTETLKKCYCQGDNADNVHDNKKDSLEDQHHATDDIPDHEDLSHNSNCNTSGATNDFELQLNSSQCNNCYSHCMSPVCGSSPRFHYPTKPPMCFKPPPHRMTRSPHSPIRPRCPPHCYPHLRPHFYHHPHHPRPFPPSQCCLSPHAHPQRHPQKRSSASPNRRPPRKSPPPCSRLNSSNTCSAQWQSPVRPPFHHNVTYPSPPIDCYQCHQEWASTPEQLHGIPPNPYEHFPQPQPITPPPISVPYSTVRSNISPSFHHRGRIEPYRSLDRSLVDRNVEIEPIVRVIRYNASSQMIGLESDVNNPYYRNNNLGSTISRYENEIAKNELTLSRLKRQLDMELNRSIY